MTSPAAMVVLIDAAIAEKITGSTGGAIKRVSDAAGVTVEHYTLDEMRLLRREYAALAADAVEAAIGGNGLGFSLVTNAEPE